MPCISTCEALRFLQPIAAQVVFTNTFSIETKLNYHKEIDRLYHAEYGNRAELCWRLGLLPVAALALFDYRGSMAGFWWVASFYLSHLCYFAILRSRPEDATSRDCTLSGITLIAVLIAYVWLPTSLVGDPDVAVSLSATAAFGTLLIFLVQRADTMLWLVIAEIAVVTVAVCAVLIQILPTVQGNGPRLVIALSGVALCGYFAQAILSHRQQRLDHEAAAKRSAQAQKMEAIGQLVGGVAHDFNNILTVLSGNLELYDVVPDPTEKDQLIREARDSAERGAVLVQQLLAYSRQTPMKISHHDLSEVLCRTLALCSRVLPSSIAAKFEVPEVPVMIKIDSNQLITALINLLINARDALERVGTILVRYEVVTLQGAQANLPGFPPEPGTYVQISVIDDGPGMSPDVLARATEPFFTTKPVGKGSGLGLSMVEGFARQSGGGLVIRSSAKGADVSIYLPHDPTQPTPEPR